MHLIKYLVVASGLMTSALLHPDRAVAQQRIGHGGVIVNDFLGDGQDRWRSGSVAKSHVYGKPWQGELATHPGENLELRFLGQVISPDNLVAPAAGDRPYVGALSIGVHTHFMKHDIEYSLGADVVLVGPQTGLDNFQSWLHQGAGLAGPSAAVVSGQVANDIAIATVAEVGRTIDLGPKAQIRPFVEARLGAETLLRAGFDFSFGNLGPKDIWVRDPVSGQRYRTINRHGRGMSYVLGADVAFVDDSIFLPASSGVLAEKTRGRVRAGLQWQGKRHSIFYGATWLSPEFQGQSSGQVLGVMRISFDF